MVTLVVRIASSTCLLVWLVLVATVDLRSRRIPNTLVLCGIAVAFSFGISMGSIGAALAGGCGLFGFYLLTKLAVGGIGGGDVKAAVAIGMISGTGGLIVWVVSSLGALLTTLVVGIVARLLSKERCSLLRHSLLFSDADCIPHGVSMALWAAGSVIATWFLV